MSFPECSWINPPSEWSLNGDCLRVTTNAATDFWRETHYGFTRDNGHFFGSSVVNAFTAQLRVRAKYQKLYDQAGIMIRIDDRRWVKAGIENSDGENLLSSVLTIERSDWGIGSLWSRFFQLLATSDGIGRGVEAASLIGWAAVACVPSSTLP